MRFILAALLMVLLCSPAFAKGGAKRTIPEGASVVLAHGDDDDDSVRAVGTYVSKGWGFSTASYWIEGPDGLILIDTQFLLSAADEFVNWAEAATGKKAKLAIVLHANPDKFNGTGILKKRGIKVVTSEQVRALLPSVHEKRLKAFYERYKPDYPAEFVLPDSFGSVTTELKAAGLTVKAHVMGAGTSEAHVVVEWEGHVFVGDLVGNGVHSWLEIGRTAEWLQRLDEIRALKPDYVHPGRGPSGDDRLLDMEANYLRFVMDAVAAEKPTGEPDKEALARIKTRVEERFVGYRYAIFLEIGLPAEWRRQAGRPR